MDFDSSSDYRLCYFYSDDKSRAAAFAEYCRRVDRANAIATELAEHFGGDDLMHGPPDSFYRPNPVIGVRCRPATAGAPKRDKPRPEGFVPARLRLAPNVVIDYWAPDPKTEPGTSFLRKAASLVTPTQKEMVESVGATDVIRVSGESLCRAFVHWATPGRSLVLVVPEMRGPGPRFIPPAGFEEMHETDYYTTFIEPMERQMELGDDPEDLELNPR